MFNIDLNLLEVFAYAHNETAKLSGQPFFDTANRLPQSRYLDYLDKLLLDMSQPGFDSIRDFVVHEIKIMTSDCAPTFFKQDDKGGSCDPLANKNFQVYCVGALSWRIAFIVRNPLGFNGTT